MQINKKIFQNASFILLRILIKNLAMIKDLML